MSMLREKKKLLLVFFLAVVMMLTTSLALAASQENKSFEDQQVKISESSPQAYKTGSMVEVFFRFIIGSTVVIGLAYVVIKIYKKNLSTTSQSQFISVLDQYTFGMNKGVFITEIGGKVLVLGVTDHNINVVTEINDPLLVVEMKEKALESKIDNQITNPYQKLLQGLIPNKLQNKNNFHTHIQHQINKLQSMVNSSPDLKGREDDQNV